MRSDMRTLHLFAGAGGGLLADLILGHTPIVAVEWDAYACQVLRERAAEGWFPGLHVHEGDVRLFDPSEYAGRVDSVAAGFPCQDLSIAGNQSGLGEGTRSGLYREVLRIAGVVRPRYLFLENVAAILSGGLGTVLGDLAARGYDCRWCCLEASGVGAPHKRDRWWCLATYADHSEQRAGSEPVRDEWDDSSGVCADVADPGVGRCSESKARQGQQPGRAETERTGEAVADSGINGWNTRQAGDAAKKPERCEPGGRGERADALANAFGIGDGTEIQRGEADRQDADGPASRAGGSGGRVAKSGLGVLADGISADLVQDWWEVEPDIGRVSTGVKNRVGMLKALGNAQVPIQAAVAWKLLGGT